MDSESIYSKNLLIKRTKKCCLLLLGFILIFAWFGIRLVTAESTREWKEADITVDDIQNISRKPNCWQITDTAGNTYSANESDIVIGQILPHSTYHIVYSPNYNNGIRAIARGETIIIDYAHNVAVYCERNMWDWILTFLGMAGSLATIMCMITNIRKERING